MITIYEIMSLVGDYPIDGQKYWANKFTDKEKAIACALEQHNLLEPKYEWLCTIVKDVEEDRKCEWCIFKGIVYTDSATATAKADEAEAIGNNGK